MQIKNPHLNIPVVLNLTFYVTNCVIALGFILKGTPTQIANPVGTSLFFLIILSLDAHTSFKLNNFIRILLMITLVSHSLFGEYLRAYYTTAYFDNILHFFGTFTFALLAYELFRSYIKVQSSHPVLFTFLLVSLFGISLGTFFELLEFILDWLLHETNQFGLMDTNLDLLFDIFGSFIAGIYALPLKKDNFP